MGDYIADTDRVYEEEKEEEEEGIEHDELKQRSNQILVGERWESITALETEARMRLSGRSSSIDMTRRPSPSSTRRIQVARGQSKSMDRLVEKRAALQQAAAANEASGNAPDIRLNRSHSLGHQELEGLVLGSGIGDGGAPRKWTLQGTPSRYASGAGPPEVSQSCLRYFSYYSSTQSGADPSAERPLQSNDGESEAKPRAALQRPQSMIVAPGTRAYDTLGSRRNIQRMEEDAAAKARALQSAQNMRDSSSPPSVTTARSESPYTRLGDRLGGAGRKLQRKDSDSEAKPRALQMPQIMTVSSTITPDNLGSRRNLQRMEEAIPRALQSSQNPRLGLQNPQSWVASGTRGSDMIGERIPLQRMEDDAEIKARALQRPESMRVVGDGAPRSSAESPDDAEAKIRPLQRSQSMGVAPTHVRFTGQTALQQIEDDVRAKARARHSSQSRRNMEPPSLSLAAQTQTLVSLASRASLQQMEDDDAVNARSQSMREFRSPDRRLATDVPTTLQRMEEDAVCKAQGRNISQSLSNSESSILTPEPASSGRPRRAQSHRSASTEPRELHSIEDDIAANASLRNREGLYIASLAAGGSITGSATDFGQEFRAEMQNRNILGQGLVVGNSSFRAPQRLSSRDTTPLTLCSLQELEHQVSRKGQCVDTNSAPSELESDTDSGENQADEPTDRRNLRPLGAFSISSNGIVLSRQRGILSNHPAIAQRAEMEAAQSSEAAHQRPEAAQSSGTSQDQPIPTPATEADPEVNSRGKLPKENECKEVSPFGFSRRFLCILLGLTVVAVAAGISIPLARKGDDSNDHGPAPQEETEAGVLDDRISMIISFIEGSVSSSEKLGNTKSPQHSALKWLSTDMLSPIPSNGSEAEIQSLVTRYSLAVFYYSLDGESWLSSIDWLDAETSECAWQFLECDDDGAVTVINTGGSFFNIGGSLPSELQHIPSLTELSVPSNRLAGFSGEIGNLVKLDVSHNVIKGTFPSVIYEMTALECLHLGTNYISGSFSTSIGSLSNLRELSIPDNRMTGVLSTHFQSMTSLRELDVAFNYFKGNFDEIFGQLSKMTSLYAQNNDISGSIGKNIVEMEFLETLAIQRNSISGSIPTEIGLLSNSLASLGLSSNVIEGRLPSEIGLLTKLSILALNVNLISGSLPSEIGNLRALVRFLADSNAFTGVLPTEVGNWNSLESLVLTFNEFSGTIPTELGLASRLATSQLNRNNFQGAIPSELGKLRALLLLRLDVNDGLTGSVPTELCSIPNKFELRIPCHVQCSCASYSCG